MNVSLVSSAHDGDCMWVQVLRVAQQGTAVSVYYHPNSANDAGPTASSAPASFTCDFDSAQVGRACTVLCAVVVRRTSTATCLILRLPTLWPVVSTVQ